MKPKVLNLQEAISNLLKRRPATGWGRRQRPSPHAKLFERLHAVLPELQEKSPGQYVLVTLTRIEVGPDADKLEQLAGTEFPWVIRCIEPSTPSSRLVLTEREKKEGWVIENINGGDVKVLDCDHIRQLLGEPKT